MWKVPPKFLCNQHLLGEHLEMHMFASAVKEKKKIDGYLRNGLVEVHNIKKRHEELVSEMLRRGMHHYSPLPKFRAYHAGKVDVKNSLRVLAKRCKECRRRMKR